MSSNRPATAIEATDSTNDFIVTIDAFDGICLTDRWVRQRADARLQTNRPTFLVVGTAIEHRGDRVTDSTFLAGDQWYQNIGRLLALHGANIVNNACPGIPDEIMRGYLSVTSAECPDRGKGIELSILRMPHVRDSHRAFAPAGFPIRGDVTVFCDVGFEILSAINAKCADVVLVVGGGIGSLLESCAAVIEGLPIICYSKYGGIANELEPLFNNHLTRFRQLKISTCPDVQSLEVEISRFCREFIESKSISQVSRLNGVISSEPQDELEVVIHSKLEKISYLHGDWEASIDEPHLLIDDEGLELPRDRAALREALRLSRRRYRLGDFDLLMTADQSAKVWGPSIDTILLLEALSKDIESTQLPPARTLLDVGCGSGILSLYARHCNWTEQAVGIDVNPDAVFCANFNACRLGLSQSARFTEQALETYAPEERFDLALANAPYLPAIDRNHSDPLHLAYVDNGMLEQLISNIGDYLIPEGRLYFTASSLMPSKERIWSAISGLAASGKAKLLATKRVPLKIDVVNASRGWAHHLVQNARHHDVDSSHSLFHNVEVWRVSA